MGQTVALPVARQTLSRTSAVIHKPQKNLQTSITHRSPVARGLRVIAGFLQDAPLKCMSVIDPAGSYLSTADSMLRKLSEGDVSAALSIYRRLKRELQSTEDFADRYGEILNSIAGKEGFSRSLSLSRFNRLFRLEKKTRVEVLVSLLSRGNINHFRQIQQEFGIPDALLAGEVPRAMIAALGRLELSTMQTLQNSTAALSLQTRTSDAFEIIPSLVEAALRSGTSVSTYALAAGVGEELLGDRPIIPLRPWQTGLCRNFQLKTYKNIDQFIVEHKEYAEFVASRKISPTLHREQLPLVSQLKISLIEAEELLQAGQKLEQFVGNPEALMKALGAHAAGWLDVDHVRKPFELGAAIFGAAQMFEYSYKPGVRRHDTVFAMPRIVELFRSSGLQADKFFEQILRQVRRDDGDYPQGTAYHHLNTLAEKLSGAIETMLQEAQSAEFIPEIRALSEHFSDTASVFQSWRSLKKYSELVDLLKSRELLIEMEALRQAGKDDLYNFLAALAFRPESQIRMETLITFWKKPAEFLSTNCTSVSPIHYTQMPHLDISPEQLRDALVTGVIDQIQALPAAAVTYMLPKKYAGLSVHRALHVALGSRSKGIAGEAINIKKLYSEAQKVLGEERSSVKEYLESGQCSRSAEIQLTRLLFNSEFGLRDEAVEVCVKLNRKSDTDGLIAGNDTASCMPFGSEKNNVYMYNPNCALLTVQIRTEHGSMRTIAQSVVTLDDEYPVTPRNAAKSLLDENSRAWEPLQGDVFKARPKLRITCDNIEIAPNYRDTKYGGIIGGAYQAFFKDYALFMEESGIQKDAMYVGLGYTEALKNLPRIKNQLLPLSPLSYSDNLADQVISVKLDGSQQVRVHEENFVCEPNGFLPSLDRENTIRPLTYLDTFAVTSIEHQRYQSSLGESFAEIANTIVAKEIGDALHQRPNISSIMTDEDGYAQGYLLAYEGRFESEVDGSTVRLPLREGQPIVYVADFATVEGKGAVAVELIGRFMKQYKEEYIDRDQLLPIVAEFRDSTSYRLLPQIVRRYQKLYGIEFEIEELPTYQLGKATMHPVILKPKI